MNTDPLLRRKSDLTSRLQECNHRLAVQRRLLRRVGYKQRTKIHQEIDRICNTIDNISDAIFDINAFLQIRKGRMSL